MLDLIVVAVIVVSAVYATYRGLVSESLAVFGWIAAAYATLFFGPICAGWMRERMDPKWLGELAGFVVVFLVILIPLHFASSRIAVNVKKSQVGTLDSVLGTGFGVLRGIAIVGISYIIYFMIFPGCAPSWITTARLYPLVYASAEIVASVTPADTPHATTSSNHCGNETGKTPSSLGDLLDDKPAPKSGISDLLKEPDRTPHKSEAKSGISSLLQDQPFKKSDRKADDDSPDAAPEKPQSKALHSKEHHSKEPQKGEALKTHTEKAQNEAEDEPKPIRKATPEQKPAKQAKKTYGAQDRHALDKLIETSHGETSGKP